jgi:hypothetical protein
MRYADTAHASVTGGRKKLAKAGRNVPNSGLAAAGPAAASAISRTFEKLIGVA